MDWSFSRKRKQQKHRKPLRRARSVQGRRLHRYEQLEDRHLLATFTVLNNLDAGAGSLRDAIDMANAAPGADVINFDAALSGATITLATGELSIEDSLTINGPGAANLTIDADLLSRVFYVDVFAGDVAINGLTLTRGMVAGSGGAIRSDTLSMLKIADSVITGSTAGADGGGIYVVGDLLLTGVTVGGSAAGAGNTAADDGGGVYGLGSVMIKNSVISGNEATTGDGGGVYALGTLSVQNSVVGGLNVGEGNIAGDDGGGLYAGTVSLQHSTVAGNTANVSGGGISATTAVIQNSTISGNEATTGSGGAIFGFSAVLRNSTVSGNTAVAGSGGGIFAANVTLQNSTVANNDATAGNGGGVYAGARLNAQNSIIVNNTAGGAQPDITAPATTNVRYSLIGNIDAIAAAGQFVVTGPAGAPNAAGNLIGDGATPITVTDAFGGGAGTLADNGGPTQTIALMAGSIAINRGNNGLAPNPNLGDQRGLPFVRISPFGGVVDMGAYEVQTPTPGNNSPVLTTATPDTSTVVGDFFSYTVPINTFTDADGDVLTYSATLVGGGALPGWLTFNPVSRTFSGTPGAGDVGVSNILLTAVDGKGGSATDQFALSVVSNPPPVVANPISDQSAVAGSPFNFTFAADTFTDPNGDPLTYSAMLSGGGALPAWLSFNPATRTFSGTPAAGDVGMLNIQVTANDGQGGVVSDNFALNVIASELPFNESFEGVVDSRIQEKIASFTTTNVNPVDGAVSFRASRTSVGSRPLATVDFVSPTTASMVTNVKVNVSTETGNGSSLWSNALVTFDYQSPSNYKFAGVFEIIDRLIIGEVRNGRVTYYKQKVFPAASNTLIPLDVTINRTTGQVTLASGATSVTHTYSSIGNGTVGVGTINANAKFDSLMIS